MPKFFIFVNQSVLSYRVEQFFGDNSEKPDDDDADRFMTQFPIEILQVPKKWNNYF